MLSIIYGVLVFVALYFFIRLLYSVYYTPGSTVLYNSPVTQNLFPTDKNKLVPQWGYNKLGMYDRKPTQYGQGTFWPKSGSGYVPNKFGSPGASPSGGMRPTFQIPSNVEIGHWAYTPEPQINTIQNIYDDSSQHVEYNTPIGWWANELY